MDLNNGIFQLDEAVSFGYNIQPICLPSSSHVNYTDQTAIVAGYYRSLDIAHYQPFKSSLLSVSEAQEFQVPIWTNKEYFYHFRSK